MKKFLERLLKKLKGAVGLLEILWALLNSKKLLGLSFLLIFLFEFLFSVLPNIKFANQLENFCLGLEYCLFFYFCFFASLKLYQLIPKRMKRREMILLLVVLSGLTLFFDHFQDKIPPPFKTLFFTILLPVLIAFFLAFLNLIYLYLRKFISLGVAIYRRYFTNKTRLRLLKTE